MCEMTCTLKIDPVILKQCIPYKYVILTSKMRKVCYEYLRVTADKTDRPVNRVLNFGSIRPTPDGKLKFLYAIKPANFIR